MASPPFSEGLRSVVVHDPFDAEAFEEIVSRAAGLRLLIEASGRPEARDLAFDLFCSLYKYFVKLLPVDRIAPEYRRHRDLLSRALELRAHGKLRAFTQLHAAEASMATELVLDALLREMARKEAEPPSESPPGETGSRAPSEEPVAEVTTEQLREILGEARENLQGASELIAAWSSGPGQETRLPPDLKLRLMRDLVGNARLRRIALAFGRYRRLGLREREKRSLRASEEVVDYLQGGDVARALAGELSNFALEEREDLFYAKLLTHQLLIYELWRREEEPRPVYLCLDTSGSMAGDKEVWAKAVALALAHMALDQKRPVETILFGDAADPLRVIPISPEDAAPARLTKVLDVASYFLGGGTDFMKPLSHVLEAIEAHGFKGNDVLFVSDGLGPLSDEFLQRFLEAKRRHDIRLTSVMIGEAAGSLGPISDSLQRIEGSLEAGDALAAGLASSFLDRSSESAARRRPQPRAGRDQPLLFDHFLPEQP